MIFSCLDNQTRAGGNPASSPHSPVADPFPHVPVPKSPRKTVRSPPPKIPHQFKPHSSKYAQFEPHIIPFSGPWKPQKRPLFPGSDINPSGPGFGPQNAFMRTFYFVRLQKYGLFRLGLKRSPIRAPMISQKRVIRAQSGPGWDEVGKETCGKTAGSGGCPKRVGSPEKKADVTGGP